MSKKPPPIFETVSSKIWAEEFADNPEKKARASAIVQGDIWSALQRIAISQNARNPARDKAETEARRIAKARWAESPMTITAMTKHVVAQLAETGSGEWSEKAVRGWITNLAPSHRRGRPRDA